MFLSFRLDSFFSFFARSDLHITRLSPNIISDIFFLFRSSFPSWYFAFISSRPIWCSWPGLGQTSHLSELTNSDYSCSDRQKTQGEGGSFHTFITQSFNYLAPMFDNWDLGVCKNIQFLFKTFVIADMLTGQVHERSALLKEIYHFPVYYRYTLTL